MFKNNNNSKKRRKKSSISLQMFVDIHPPIPHAAVNYVDETILHLITVIIAQVFMAPPRNVYPSFLLLLCV